MHDTCHSPTSAFPPPLPLMGLAAALSPEWKRVVAVLPVPFIALAQATSAKTLAAGTFAQQVRVGGSRSLDCSAKDCMTMKQAIDGVGGGQAE